MEGGADTTRAGPQHESETSHSEDWFNLVLWAILLLGALDLVMKAARQVRRFAQNVQAAVPMPWLSHLSLGVLANLLTECLRRAARF